MVGSFDVIAVALCETGVTLMGTGVGRLAAGTEERLGGISGSGLCSRGAIVSFCLPPFKVLLPRDLEFKKLWKPFRLENGRAVVMYCSLGGDFCSVTDCSGRKGWDVGVRNLCLSEAVVNDSMLDEEILSVTSSLDVVFRLVLVLNLPLGRNRLE